MTSRLAVRRLAGLPRDLAADVRLYAKPLPAAAGARQVEVLIRGDDHVLRIAAPAEAARAWAARLPERHARRFACQMARFSRPPAPFAGLDMAACRAMGIVNATPDSFSDGGEALDATAGEERGRAMVAAGAALLDIGGESTRPGARPVALGEELRRVLPIVERLAGCGVPLSIDSRKAAVMAAALDAGAAVVNDVSALAHDPAALALVAERGCPVVLMHALAEPATMQAAPAYGHAALDIFDALEARVEACRAAGIARGRIAVDPGIGFGKTAAHNLVLLADLALFRSLGCPVLLGASRKSFIAAVAGEAPPQRRLGGSVAAALAGAAAGASILRVHDVASTVQALAVWRAVAEAA